jgi:hypothetical protein
MRKVLIGTPSYDGKVDVRYVDSLVQTLASAPEGITVNFLFIAQDALVQRARNDLLMQAVMGEVDDLVFIDADQAWNPKWFYDLLAHDVDVVGLPVVKKGDIEQYNVKCVSHKLDIRNDGLMQVDGLGTGFLRLTKKALDHVWANAIAYTENGLEKRMAFNVTVADGEFIGEDISFCKLLTPLGIYLDTRYTIPHVGTKVYVGKFDSWLSGIISQRGTEPMGNQASEKKEEEK